MKSILTVQIPAATQDLILLDDLKADLGLVPLTDIVADQARDAVLSRRITEASMVAAAYCHRTFNGKNALLSETVIEEFRPERFIGMVPFMEPYPFPGILSERLNDPPPIKLRRWPVTDVQSVVETGLAGDNTTLVQDVDYEVDGEKGMITRLLNGYPYPWRFLKLTVTYTGGLMPNAIPFDIQKAVLSLARLGWFERNRDPQITRQDIPGVISQSFWVGAFKDTTGLPLGVTSDLAPYVDYDV